MYQVVYQSLEYLLIELDWMGLWICRRKEGLFVRDPSASQCRARIMRLLQQPHYKEMTSMAIQRASDEDYRYPSSSTASSSTSATTAAAAGGSDSTRKGLSLQQMVPLPSMQELQDHFVIKYPSGTKEAASSLVSHAHTLSIQRAIRDIILVLFVSLPCWFYHCTCTDE